MACILETKNNRVSWKSPKLQEQFLRAVNQLGIDKATPKQITELMDVPGLKKEHVASHLQKFRLRLKTKSKSGRENSKEDHVPNESLEVVESMPEQDQYHVPNETLEVFESMPKQDQYHVPNSGMEQQVSTNITGFSPDNVDDFLCTEYNDNRVGGQFHLINGDASVRGIELAQPLNTSSSVVLKEHFKPGDTLGTSLRDCQSFDQRSSNHCFNGSICRENYRRQIENLEHFLDLDDQAPISNLAVDPLIYFSQDWNMMCAGDRIWSPTLQLHQVCNAVDNKVFYDDVQIIDNMNFGGQCHLINGEASGRVKELAQSLNTSSMVLKEHFEPGATLGTSLRHCQSFDEQSSISNMPFDHLIYYAQNSDMMCAGNWSPTPQMNQVSNAVDNDVQIIDNMKLDFWEEQLPAKRRRLMHFPGGSDGILTSFTFM